MKELNDILVIGVGNNSRQDDGIGWKFLEILEIEYFNPDNLVYKYQLMVEDAELISKYSTVYFVDACTTPLPNGFEIKPLQACEKITYSTHKMPPEEIIYLTQTIYNKFPKTYLIKIKGYQWDLQIGLSKKAQKNVEKAVKTFKKIIKK